MPAIKLVISKREPHIRKETTQCSYELNFILPEVKVSGEFQKPETNIFWNSAQDNCQKRKKKS